MKRFTIAIICGLLLMAVSSFAQETESYTALKVTGGNVPTIDGTIDAIWESVDIVALEKVPENEKITVPNPEPDDYSAEFGILWNDDGIFFLFRITDNKIVIEDDFFTDNEVDADQWWSDDNVNILFSKDLVNTTFEQLEFAYQPGVDQEEKQTGEFWHSGTNGTNVLIDANLVEAAWNEDNKTWTLETFIDWESFGAVTISDNMKIYLEMRARDDDDTDSWESMYQWSTTNYGVEGDGIGLGEVTLSATEVTPTVGISNLVNLKQNISLTPNVIATSANLNIYNEVAGNIKLEVYSILGSKVFETTFENIASGNQNLSVNFEELNNGAYILNVESATASNQVKFIKK